MKQIYAALMVLSLILAQAGKVQGADYFMISDLGASAETIGMGAVEGFNQSASTIFENPAGLSRIPHQSLSLFTTTVMGEVHYSNIALSTTTQYGSFGIGFMQAAVFGIEHTTLDTDTDQSVISDGQFDYKNTIYKFSYQRQLKPNLSLGVSSVMYNSQFYDVKGTGYDFDAGAIWTKGKFETSLFARNILPHGKVKYNESRIEPLPFQLVGSAKLNVKGVDILPQIKIQQENVLPSIGFRYSPGFLPFLDFLAGYKQHLTATNESRQNLTFGFGLNLYGLHFNYAYERSDYIPMDNKSYFSINTSF